MSSYVQCEDTPPLFVLRDARRTISHDAEGAIILLPILAFLTLTLGHTELLADVIRGLCMPA